LSANSILPEEFAGVTPEAADALHSSLAEDDVIVGNPEQPNDLEDLLTFETRVYPPSPENGARFAASRKAEINGLLEANVFGVMKRSGANADGCRIFKSRFVDAVKNPATAKAIDKSRFVICGYQDKGAKELLTKAPTVSKNSTRVLLCLAASSRSHGIRLRDINQAFVQSRTHVQRRVVCEAPAELGLSEEYVLVVMHPIYGLPEAALHWFLTYFEFHKQGLGMSPTFLDSCLFFKRPESSPTAVTESPASAELTSSSTGKMPDGVVALQVDDSMI
jgi:hypothetical protein